MPMRRLMMLFVTKGVASLLRSSFSSIVKRFFTALNLKETQQKYRNYRGNILGFNKGYYLDLARTPKTSAYRSATIL